LKTSPDPHQPQTNLVNVSQTTSSIDIGHKIVPIGVGQKLALINIYWGATIILESIVMF